MDKVIGMVQIICVNEDSLFYEILESQERATASGLPGGIALVVDKYGKLIGTITDGDMRRAILTYRTTEIPACDIMQANPICFPDSYSYQEILEELPSELETRGRKSKRFLSKIILVDEHNCPSRVFDYHQLWEQRVASHRHIVVAGLGYVGLTLALALADKGFYITGYDVEQSKVDELNNGSSYVHEQGLLALLQKTIGRNFNASITLPAGGDVYIISVGTPVVKEESSVPSPTMKYLREVSHSIGRNLTQGNLVVLRSTVPVGTCRRIVIPILEKFSGLKCGADFHLSFAPERTTEGNAIQELRQLPQVIGGINSDSIEATVAIFRDLTSTIIRVDSLESAEMVKLINNSFRDLVFSYSNQVAQLAAAFNIDVVEVIKAANKGYPRNPVPLPSPGVGGPCLTKDPYIFANIVGKKNLQNTLFVRAREINESMHNFIASRIVEQLIHVGKVPKDCDILVCGLAFKGNPETGDLRDSSALAIIEELNELVGTISAYDSVAPAATINQYGIHATDIPAGFNDTDAVLFLNNHISHEKIDGFSMVTAMNEYPIIFDGWNQFRSQDILTVKPSVYMGLSVTKSSIEVV